MDTVTFRTIDKPSQRKALYNEKRASLLGEGFLKNRNTLSFYFKPGHLDTLNFGSLFNAVTYLQDLGIENVANRICQVAFKARQAIIDRDLLSVAVKNRKDHSNIFNLTLPSSIISELQDQNIIFPFRGMGIRVSFHFYNSEQDLKKL